MAEINVFETIVNSPSNMAKQIKEATYDKQKAIEFINRNKKYAVSYDEGDEFKPIIGDKIAAVILLLKRKHNIN